MNAFHSPNGPWMATLVEVFKHWEKVSVTPGIAKWHVTKPFMWGFPRLKCSSDSQITSWWKPEFLHIYFMN